MINVNIHEPVMLEEVKKLKPASVKGLYIQSIALSSTMGPGVKIAPSSLV